MKLELVTEGIVSECTTIVDQIRAQQEGLSPYEVWRLAAMMQQNRILDQTYVTNTELHPSAFEKIAMELEKAATALEYMESNMRALSE